MQCDGLLVNKHQIPQVSKCILDMHILAYYCNIIITKTAWNS